MMLPPCNIIQRVHSAMGILTMKYSHEGVNKMIDLSYCEAGKVYHFITDFGASTTLDIPKMEEEVIIVS